MIELTPKVLNDAEFLARTHGLRAYDAVQLAAAREVDRLYRSAGLAPITLVSADRELNAAAATEGLVTDDPCQHP